MDSSPSVMVVPPFLRHRRKQFSLSPLLLLVAMTESTFAACLVTPTAPLLTFLEHVQDAALAAFGSEDFDPKLYVDMSLKFSLDTVEEAFDALPRSANASIPAKELLEFMEKYLDGAGDDLVVVEPPDFYPEPDRFLPKVENPAVRAWALEVHSLWKNLSRQVSGSVRDQSEFHTLLPLPERFVIPGSRFREVYYWDSYWVIRGLLASKMHKTAKGIVTNLMFLLDKYGHVLNGARVYYTNRSQPPLLSAMVRAIYNATHDIDLVHEALPLLLKEHKFWTSGIHEITVQDSEGNSHKLSRYFAMWDKPRPESATIDKLSASNISSNPRKHKFYHELASAAESGWDFSTRWMRNPEDITTLSTTSILPVDLNVYLLGMELDISFLAKVVSNDSITQHFTKASIAREKAISSILWSERTGQWLDYWVSNDSCKLHEGHKFESGHQNETVFASNFIPLWIASFHSDSVLVEKVMKSLQNSGLLCAAGIATSLTNSGQQWDYPNGWAPIQHMIVEGLARSGSSEAKALAEDIAVRWIRTNYAAYKKMGVMHEKYDVRKCGAYGGGGEYVPQTGFGWSNGVALAFLEEFGWPQHLNIDCE